MDCKANIGDLCQLVRGTSLSDRVSYQAPRTVFSDRPEQSMLNEHWVAKKPYAVDYVSFENDIFVLLETNDVGRGSSYPKVITKKGIVGYLYLHDDFEKIVKAVV